MLMSKVIGSKHNMNSTFSDTSSWIRQTNSLREV